MKLRCRPGDLAVIVEDRACGDVDLGKLVLVLRASEFPLAGKHLWTCDQLGQHLAHSSGRIDDGYIDIWDRKLRPIRDSDGEDESLSWLSVPSSGKVTA
jgi:hypothetical protein